MLRDEAKAFCEKELNREYVRWMDENCDFIPDELWQKMAALGHFEMMIPTEYGGLGLGSLETDRKSVVEGKSVDLGGRRIIKKKHTRHFRLGNVGHRRRDTSHHRGTHCLRT